MIKLRQLRCSFCRKSETQVAKLVAGPRVYICDVCVAVASRMMEDDSHDDSHTAEVKPAVWRRLSARVRELIRGRESRRVSSVTTAC
jgi:ATP-dependent Clp protease ATP-binding subunit ClpX